MTDGFESLPWVPVRTAIISASRVRHALIHRPLSRRMLAGNCPRDLPPRRCRLDLPPIIRKVGLLLRVGQGPWLAPTASGRCGLPAAGPSLQARAAARATQPVPSPLARASVAVAYRGIAQGRPDPAVRTSESRGDRAGRPQAAGMPARSSLPTGANLNVARAVGSAAG
jgi:hypothetical protein